MFKSPHAYMRFEWAVKGRTRYVLDDELKAFLDEVLATCTARRRKIKAGMDFFRAQLGNAWRSEEEGGEPYIPEAHSPERMIPFRDRAFRRPCESQRHSLPIHGNGHEYCDERSPSLG